VKRLDSLVAPRPRASNEEIYAAALRGETCAVLGLGAEAVAMPVGRWSAGADDSDHRVLDRCVGSTIDIGCGPGRMTAALRERGNLALGIDVVPEAVEQASARGATAVVADVFDEVPHEGGWDTALLADGNIGIGGDPVVLLRRVRALLHDGGRVVLDLARPGTGLVTRSLRLRVGELTSEPFRWAAVSAEALHDIAEAAGFRVATIEQHGARWFAELRVGRAPWR
jgi:SAM-dependent methyltransferase